MVVLNGKSQDTPREDILFAAILDTCLIMVCTHTEQ